MQLLRLVTKTDWNTEPGNDAQHLENADPSTVVTTTNAAELFVSVEDVLVYLHATLAEFGYLDAHGSLAIDVADMVKCLPRPIADELRRRGIAP